MDRRDFDQEDIEERLRDHLRSQAGNAEASSNLWQRIQPRLGKQKRWWLAIPGPSDFMGLRPLPALAVAVLLIAATGVTSLLVLSPWQGDDANSIAAIAAAPTDTPAPRATSSLAFSTEDSDRALERGWQLTTIDRIDRMVAYNADLALEVADVGEAVAMASQAAEDVSGFTVSSHHGDEGASITIRVPTERFDDARQSLRSLGVRVLSESTNSQDVTEEYVDVDSRLRNWQAAETQYLELIRRAQNVDETLRVQQELFLVRQEIERIRGRMQYLEGIVDMASITVQLRPASSPEPLIGQEWSAYETGKSALRTLSDFGQWLAGAAIWIGVFSPVWVVLGIALLLLGRRVVRG